MATVPIASDLTLPEIREILADLYHEIDNQGSGRESELFARAHATLAWLLEKYLDVTC